MNTCKIKDCSRQATRKGLCNAHYMQDYRRKQKSRECPRCAGYYETGLANGRDQVASAVSDALDTHGVRCAVSNNFLYLHIPTGKSFEIDLANY